MSVHKETSREPTVVVVGCGYWGRNLVRNFRALNALAGVCDTDHAAASATAHEAGVPVVGFDEALISDVDALVIASPAAHHGELASRALASGKHVFVEKPLALDIQEATTVVELSERVGRVLMVGHLLQYHPGFLKLRSIVDAGELGRVQYLYSNRVNLGRIRREEDILWSFAPHDISMILSLVRQDPEEVWATGAAYLHRSIADVTTTHMTFPGGERAHVFVSWLHPYKEQRLVVVGDRGMAVFDDGQPWDRKLQLFFHRIDWREGLPEPVRAVSQPIPVEEAEPLAVECRHFLDCVRDGGTPRTDGHEALRVLRVLKAASTSMVNGSRSRLPTESPFTGVFVHESSYVDSDCEIGPGTKIWHFTHILRGSRIGAECSIGQNVMVGPNVVIGDRCKIQNNVSVYRGVVLEDGVFCGPSCVFTNVVNPRAGVERKDEFQSTHVGRGATIGANATIVCGNSIGEYAFVGAGAVVTADVPPHGLVVGVPARRIGWVSHDGERLDEGLVCPRSGRQYRQVGPERLEEDR